MRNNTLHTTNSHEKSEHGSATSYVVGFILSLIFSLIPYYLVVNKSLAASTLLTVILGFGVIQMLIQIFFFLHLGRDPKPLYNVSFFVATVSIILVVVFGSIFIMDHLNYNMSPDEVVKYQAQKEGLDQVGGEKTGACQDLGKNHKVTIENNRVSLITINAKLCDTISFVNYDDTERVIAFGAHPKHTGYAGEDELSLRKGRSSFITLNQVGEYLFHDHLDPTIYGYFTVSE